MDTVCKKIFVDLKDDDITFRLSGSEDFVIIENDSEIFLPIPVDECDEIVKFIEKEKRRNI